MNKMIVSQEELKKLFVDETPLKEVFRHLETEALKTGQIVCRFSVNNLTLSEDEEKKFSTCTLAEVQTIAVESQSPKVILHEVLNNWLDSLPKLIKKSDTLSQTIRFNGLENHFAQFVDVVDSCQFLVESLISLRSLCADHVKEQEFKWKKSENLTASAIAQALSCFEKKDLNSLADVLEYDLGHCLQSWLETLEKLRDDVMKNDTAEPLAAS